MIASGALDPLTVSDAHRLLFEQVAPAQYAGVPRGRGGCLNVLVVAHGGTGRHWTQVEQHVTTFCASVRDSLSFRQTAPSPPAILHLADRTGRALGELMNTHPFINGNGRLVRILWSAWMLALRAGEIDVALTARPSERFEDAARQAMQKDFGPFIQMVVSTLANG